MNKQIDNKLSVHPHQKGVVTFAQYAGYYKNGTKLKTFEGVQVENVLWYIKPDNTMTYAMINLGEITKTYPTAPEGTDKRLIEKYNEEKERLSKKYNLSDTAPRTHRTLEIEVTENEFKLLNAYRQLNKDQKLEVVNKIKSFL